MRPSAASSVLYRCLEPRRMASVRLVCFPYAGAGASAFRLWPAGLPNTIEVLAAQLPGREGRLREPPARDWKSLVAEAGRDGVGSAELRKLLGLRVMADCPTSYEYLVWAVRKELCVRPGFREIALSHATNGPTGRYLRLAHLGQ